MSVKFSKSALEQFSRILLNFPTKEASLIPVFHLAHKEFGEIDTDVVQYLANLLKLPQEVLTDFASKYNSFWKAGR